MGKVNVRLNYHKNRIGKSMGTITSIIINHKKQIPMLRTCEIVCVRLPEYDVSETTDWASSN
jgi:hypothetical protein